MSSSAAPPPTAALAESIAIMARLRAPGGCPWDREQTFDTIKRYTLEETYEVFDAIDRRAWPDLKDELGDLLLQVLFYAQMASEAGYFNLEDVAANLNAKLIRRHPHVFGEARAQTPADVKLTWEAIKQTEKLSRDQMERNEQPSKLFLDAVPRHMPALLEAYQLGQQAAKLGFDWPDTRGLFDKLAEESAELQRELQQPSPVHPAVAEELGDLLFTAVNLARHLALEPEFALRRANVKFRGRFNAMETAAGSAEILRGSSPQELDRRWMAAKLSASAAESPTADESHPDSSSRPPA